MKPSLNRARRLLRIGALRLAWLASFGALPGGANALPQADPATATATATAAATATPTVTAPLSADAQALRLRSLAASCAQCHGTDGRPVAGSVLPALAGLPAPTLRAQMQAFKNGTRPASVMTQLARGFSEAQIDQLAAFFAAQAAVDPALAAPAKDPS